MRTGRGANRCGGVEPPAVHSAPGVAGSGCCEERRVRDARGETEPLAQSRARATYDSDVSVALLLSVSESAAAPAPPMLLFCWLQRDEEGQGCSWRDRAAGTEPGARDFRKPRQRRVALERLRERCGARVADSVVVQAAARRGESGMLVARQGRRHNAGRATNLSNVSVALFLSASESAAAPASPIWLSPRLQRGEEGQGCSWRDRAAGIEQGARDLQERRSKAQCIRKLVTIFPLLSSSSTTASAPSWRRLSVRFKRPPPDNSSLNRTRAAASRAVSLLPYCCLQCA